MVQVRELNERGRVAKPVNEQQGPPMAAGRRAVEQCVTVTYLPDRNPSFVMPTGDELWQLHEIVVGQHSQLAPRSHQIDEAFDGFCRAFLRIGHLGRDKLNDKYSLSGWIDDGTIWLRDNQAYPTTLTARDFVCAVLAHGDVDYVPLNRFPYDCSAFGLRRDGSGRKATDGWRAVLTTGRLREPVPLPGSTAAPSAAQIVVCRGG